MSRYPDTSPGFGRPKSAIAKVALIVDDEQFRRGLETSLTTPPRHRLVGSFDSVRHAVRLLSRDGPDIILLDVQLQGHSGITALGRLRQRWPRTRCILLTNSDDPADLFGALAEGPAGLLLKTEAGAQIVHAVDEVVAGGVPLSRAIARRIVQSFARRAEPAHPRSTISPRESEIMHELTRGLTYKEIGRKLGISSATVKNHLYRIYGKLGVRSRTEAVVTWLRR